MNYSDLPGSKPGSASIEYTNSTLKGNFPKDVAAYTSKDTPIADDQSKGDASPSFHLEPYDAGSFRLLRFLPNSGLPVWEAPLTGYMLGDHPLTQLSPGIEIPQDDLQQYAQAFSAAIENMQRLGKISGLPVNYFPGGSSSAGRVTPWYDDYPITGENYKEGSESLLNDSSSGSSAWAESAALREKSTRWIVDLLTHFDLLLGSISQAKGTRFLALSPVRHDAASFAAHPEDLELSSAVPSQRVDASHATGTTSAILIGGPKAFSNSPRVRDLRIALASRSFAMYPLARTCKETAISFSEAFKEQQCFLEIIRKLRCHWKIFRRTHDIVRLGQADANFPFRADLYIEFFFVPSMGWGIGMNPVFLAWPPFPFMSPFRAQVAHVLFQRKRNYECTASRNHKYEDKEKDEKFELHGTLTFDGPVTHFINHKYHLSVSVSIVDGLNEALTRNEISDSQAESLRTDGALRDSWGFNGNRQMETYDSTKDGAEILTVVARLNRELQRARLVFADRAAYCVLASQADDTRVSHPKQISFCTTPRDSRYQGAPGKNTAPDGILSKHGNSAPSRMIHTCYYHCVSISPSSITLVIKNLPIPGNHGDSRVYDDPYNFQEGQLSHGANNGHAVDLYVRISYLPSNINLQESPSEEIRNSSAPYELNRMHGMASEASDAETRTVISWQYQAAGSHSSDISLTNSCPSRTIKRATFFASVSERRLRFIEKFMVCKIRSLFFAAWKDRIFELPRRCLWFHLSSSLLPYEHTSKGAGLLSEVLQWLLDILYSIS